MDDRRSVELGANPMPELKPEPMAELQPAQPQKRLGWPIVVALLGALVAAPLLGLQFGAQRSAPLVTVAPSETPLELAARYAAAFTGAHSRLMPVDLSTNGIQDAVVTLIPASEPVARNLIAEALAGRRALGKVVIWDNIVEDGDVVTLECGGLSVVVTLKKAGDTFVFPYQPGDVLRIVGTKDGDGGGITAAIEVAAGPIPLPPLHPGEARELPLY
jgi:hypothetical protein